MSRSIIVPLDTVIVVSQPQIVKTEPPDTIYLYELFDDFLKFDRFLVTFKITLIIRGHRQIHKKILSSQQIMKFNHHHIERPLKGVLPIKILVCS